MAMITRQDLCALRLTLVQTSGGTPSAVVNAAHYEARLPFLRELTVRLRGFAVHDYFNDFLSAKLCMLARVLQ